MAFRSGRRWLLAVTLLAAFVAAAMPSVAHAQNRAAEAKRAYQRGWKALQAGNYADAYEHYKRSYELVPRPRTLFNIAVAEEQLGRYDDALRHYAEFVEQAEPRDAEFKRQAIEKRAALEKRLMGQVKVTSDPSGAEVYLDGESNARGRTPLTLDLMAGDHTLKLVAPDAAPVTRSVAVTAGRTARARFSLNVTVPVVISVVPADGQIRRHGDDAPVQGSYRNKLQPGKHRFEVTRDGYEPQSFEVTVKAGHVYEREVVLRDAGGQGFIVVTSNIAGATVSIDGMVVGTTSLANNANVARPALRTMTSLGEHTVFVEDRRGLRWRKKLHVSPNETVAVDIDYRASSRKRRVARWSLAGIGTAGLLAGGTLGVMAIQDVTEPVDDNHARGKSRALVSDVLIIGGAAAIVAAWKLRDAPTTKATVVRSHSGK